jgi:hypothetical protein
MHISEIRSALFYIKYWKTMFLYFI